MINNGNQLAGQKMHGHATIMYLYLSCVRAIYKNTVQILLRDISWCCKEAPFPSKCYGGMGCAVVQQASS